MPTPNNEALFFKALNELNSKLAASAHNIFVINSCFHDDNITKKALNTFAKELDQYLINPNYSIADLDKINIRSCYGCFFKGKEYCVKPCVVNEEGNAYNDKNDQMPIIYEGISNSDLLIVISSAFSSSLTGDMRKVIERSESLINAKDFYKENSIKKKAGAAIIISDEHSSDVASHQVMDWFKDMGVIFTPESIVTFNCSNDVLKSSDLMSIFNSNKDVQSEIRNAAKRTGELVISLRNSL